MELYLALLVPTGKVRYIILAICLEVKAFTT
jgi:hypothetical protein